MKKEESNGVDGKVVQIPLSRSSVLRLVSELSDIEASRTARSHYRAKLAEEEREDSLRKQKIIQMLYTAFRAEPPKAA